jgi:hypothetical protein
MNPPSPSRYITISEAQDRFDAVETAGAQAL